MNEYPRLPAWLGYSALGMVVLLLISCVVAWPLQFIFYLAAGWVYYLARVIPRITVDVGGVLTGVAALAGFVAGLHMLLRWLYRNTSDVPPRRWRLRWTAGLAGLVIVMFAAGIATVGVVHQTGWLISSPEPLIGGREGPARSKSANNLKQALLAHHSYADAHELYFPPGNIADNHGELLHGWQATILPYIEQESVHAMIRFDRPWDASENKPALGTSIPTFLYTYPDFPIEENGFALSHYAGNIHVLTPRTGLRLNSDFKPGTSNKIVLGEVAAGFRPWGHPLNLRDPGRGIHRTADAFAGPRSDGTTVFAFADGSVRSIKPTISPAVLRALATPAGGDDPGPDWDQ